MQYLFNCLTFLFWTEWPLTQYLSVGKVDFNSNAICQIKYGIIPSKNTNITYRNQHLELLKHSEIWTEKVKKKKKRRKKSSVLVNPVMSCQKILIKTTWSDNFKLEYAHLTAATGDTDLYPFWIDLVGYIQW